MKIGLTYTGTEAKHNNYVNWIKGHDPIEVVTLSEDLNNLDAVADCDGIVLAGGIDIAPEYYSGHAGYANAPEHFNRARDAFETAVFQKSREAAIPLLGICRGMQLVNCIYGGTLVQDLAEKNAVHRVADNTDKVHGIAIAPGSLLQEAIGGLMGAVNSAHHQALGRIGTGLQVTATSPDGVAEALEYSTPLQQPFLLCVQWHPERLYHYGLQNSSPSQGIRKKFLAAIKK